MIGFNGVDNGRIWFHNVRIPRVGGMLDRFSQVLASGEYKTVIPNLHLRNAAHLGGIIFTSCNLICLLTTFESRAHSN